jgi:YHS domain-containing protein
MRALFIFLLAAPMAVACGRAEPQREPTPAPAASPVSPAVPAPAAAALQRVPSTHVCMMNNRFMGTAQMPVQVEGKTYYACCDMCVKRLNTDPSIRSAIDPVTKKPVDKSNAVIGKLPSGDVVYFESEASLRRYPAS